MQTAVAHASPSLVFLMIPRPPRSALLPYTTLFRSSVAVLPLRATEAATGEPPAGVKVKLLLVIVDAFIALEKVAVGATVTATAVALLARVFAVTVGPLFTVVNDQLTAGANATPSAA